MDKKYQVFVSSTYEDLKEERAAAIQCLLENDCIPVGMEQFPASEMSQMEYIKMMIDDCDYYVLISAGRYGNLDKDGIGFTEKEYHYAKSKKIPIMSLLVKDIGKLNYDKCEQTDIGKRKLEAFRRKITDGRLVDFYTDIGSLKLAIIKAIHRCIKDYPAIGWIRANSVETQMNNPDEIKKEIQKIVSDILDQRTLSKEEIDNILEKAFDETNEKIESLRNDVSNVPQIVWHPLDKEVSKELNEI